MATDKPSDKDVSPGKRMDVDKLLGTKIGRFRITQTLGRGAMGAVMLAEDVTLKRPVAFKLLPAIVDDPRQRVWLEQFIREARAAAILVHPAIVQIFEVGKAGDFLYIAMEVLDGGNLDQKVRQDGPLDFPKACEYCAQVAEGLAYAHEKGIVHRDIKPANLMLTGRNHCKLADFGVATIDDPDDRFKLPWKGVGTPHYMAPEAARGQSSPRSDIFSLTAVLWFLLTGKPPFALKTHEDVVRVHTEIPLPDLKSLRPDVPDSLVQLIDKGLAYDPADRFATADEMARELKIQSIPVARARPVRSATPAAPESEAPPPVRPESPIQVETPAAPMDDLAALASATADATVPGAPLAASSVSMSPPPPSTIMTPAALASPAPSGKPTGELPRWLLPAAGAAVVLVVIGVIIAIVARGGGTPNSSPTVPPSPVAVTPSPAPSPTPSPVEPGESPVPDVTPSETTSVVPDVTAPPMLPGMEPAPSPTPAPSVPVASPPVEPPTPAPPPLDLAADPVRLFRVDAAGELVQLTLQAAKQDGLLYGIIGTVKGAPNRSGSTWMVRMGEGFLVTMSSGTLEAIWKEWGEPAKGGEYLSGRVLYVKGPLTVWRDTTPNVSVREARQVRHLAVPTGPITTADAARMPDLVLMKQPIAIEADVAAIDPGRTPKPTVLTLAGSAEGARVVVSYTAAAGPDVRKALGVGKNEDIVGKTIRATGILVAAGDGKGFVLEVAEPGKNLALAGKDTPKPTADDGAGATPGKPAQDKPVAGKPSSGKTPPAPAAPLMKERIDATNRQRLADILREKDTATYGVTGTIRAGIPRSEGGAVLMFEGNLFQAAVAKDALPGLEEKLKLSVRQMSGAVITIVGEIKRFGTTQRAMIDIESVDQVYIGTKNP